MKLKIGLMMIVMVFAAAYLPAQNSTLGFYAGPTYSAYSGNDNHYTLQYNIFVDNNITDNSPRTLNGNYTAVSRKSTPRFGVMAGIYDEILLRENGSGSNKLFFRPEIAWKHTQTVFRFTQPANISGPYFNNGGAGLFNSKETTRFKNVVRVNTLDVPLLLRYRTTGSELNPVDVLTNSAFITVGPSISFILNHSNEYSGSMGSVSAIIRTNNNNLNQDNPDSVRYSFTRTKSGTDNLKSMYYSLTLGFGWQFKNFWGLDEQATTLEIRGNFGLDSVTQSNANEIWLNSAILLVGYKF
jgi:hypothetical protein